MTGFPVRQETRTDSITSTPFVPVTGHRPLVIKDEWTLNANEYQYMDILEGRRAIPAHPVRSVSISSGIRSRSLSLSAIALACIRSVSRFFVVDVVAKAVVRLHFLVAFASTDLADLA